MAGKGRGWHGDSEGHARAGRKGGKASSGIKRSSRSDNDRGSNLTYEELKEVDTHNPEAGTDEV